MKVSMPFWGAMPKPEYSGATTNEAVILPVQMGSLQVISDDPGDPFAKPPFYQDPTNILLFGILVAVVAGVVFLKRGGKK